MAPADNGRPNGQRIAVWSVVGAIVTGLIGYFSLVNIAQKPLEERIIALGERLAEMATDTSVWRTSFSAEIDRRLAQLSAQAEERRAAMYDRLSSTDADRAAQMHEFHRRLDVIDQDRARNIGAVTEQLQQFRERLAMLDKRSSDLAASIVKIQEERGAILQRAAANLQEIQDQIKFISDRIKQIEMHISGGKDAFRGSP